MKKTKTFMILIAFIAIFIGINKINALDITSLNYLDKINMQKDSDNNQVVVTLDSEYLANNPSINYQIIQITEEEENAFSEKMISTVLSFIDCVGDENNNYEFSQMMGSIDDLPSDVQEKINECKITLAPSLTELSELTPSFDENNWVEQALSSNDNTKLTYNVPLTENYDAFVFWVKTKDLQNNDAYNMILFSTGSVTDLNGNVEEANSSDDMQTLDNNNAITSSNEESQSVNTPDTKKAISYITAIIGSLLIIIGTAIICSNTLKKKKHN